MYGGIAFFRADAAPPFSPDLITGGNLWKVTSYSDSRPLVGEPAVQELCFFPNGVDGTRQRYDWVSTTFPDWYGEAAQEGDQISMQGDFTFGFFTGHDALVWEIVTTAPKTEGAGHWVEWLFSVGIRLPFFLTAKFDRLGECPYATAEEAIEAGRNVAAPVNRSGRSLSPAGSALPPGK